MVAEARRVAHETNTAVTVLEGPAVASQGLGGLWAVGKAAELGPSLVVLSYAPPAARGPSVGLVGKGIVYDTGGLSLKGKFDMPGMKNDLGGAAAVLAAFEAAVRLRLPRRIVAALCLAENAIGPAATRPDDVITLHSGRTVEVNNTDAEGRLVLADGLSWLIKNHRPDQLIDLATLTGAQLVATGKRHAAVISSDEALENLAVDLGKRSGDLVHPLPFAPELFRREFASAIADMKNSVKDRSNAQSSCAAQFLYDHIAPYEGAWIHVDMAGPVCRDGRGTGYGVGLVLGLLGLFEAPAT
jgi:probable aminopeptidase NPEPL1